MSAGGGPILLAERPRSARRMIGAGTMGDGGGSDNSFLGRRRRGAHRLGAHWGAGPDPRADGPHLSGPPSPADLNEGRHGFRLMTRLLLGLGLVAAVTTMALLLFHGISDAQPSCTETWVGAPGGDFGTATNWSPASVPGASDWICSSAGSSISVSSSQSVEGTLGGEITLESGGELAFSDSTDQATIETLVATGGTLYTAGDTELLGGGSSTSTWTSGIIDGSGSLTVAAGGQLSATPDGVESDELVVPVVVDGTFALSTANTEGSLLSIGCDGASFTVGSGGVFDLPADDNGEPALINDCGTTAIAVQSGGVLEKTGGTGTSSFEASVTLEGTLKATTGTLDAGTLTIDPGANLVGNVLPSGVSASLDGNITIPNGATWAVRGASLATSGQLTVASGGQLLWTSGIIDGSGSLTVAAGGQLSATPDGVESDELVVPVVVDGTFALSTANTEGSLLSIGCDGASFTVGSGGVFDLPADDNGEPALINDCGTTAIAVQSGGVLKKTGGTGTSSLEASVTLEGTLKATTGTLDPGSLTVDAGANLVGNVLPTGTTATFGSGATVANGENWLWTGAVFSGSNPLTVAAGGQLSATPDGVESDELVVPVVVDGTFALSTANTEGSLLSIGCDGASFTVGSGGVFDLPADDNGEPALINDCGTTAIAVQSGGVLEKTGGTGTSSLEASVTLEGTLKATTGTLDPGSLTVDAGANLVGNVLPTGTTATFGSGATVANGENWLWTGAVFSGSNPLTVAAGGQLSATPDGVESDELVVPVVVDGTFALSTANTEGSLLSIGCDGASFTVGSGGVFDLPADDNGEPALINDCGTTAIAVQSGGVLEKTGGTGTSSLEASVTLEGTLKATTGTLDVGSVTNISGGVLDGGTYQAGSGTTSGHLDIEEAVTQNDAVISLKAPIPPSTRARVTVPWEE